MKSGTYRIEFGGHFNDLLHNWVFWVAVIYLLIPVEFLPDAMPVVGTLDDLVPFVVSLIVQSRKAIK